MPLMLWHLNIFGYGTHVGSDFNQTDAKDIEYTLFFLANERSSQLSTQLKHLRK